jgi:pSer/pThr/pTyr-binding forkhead associated (FHA) protein
MYHPIILLQLPTPRRGVHIVSPGIESVVGRSSKCDVVIDHPSVSRRHALLSVDEAGMTVTDLSSKNGTFVGSIRVVGAAVVSPGSRIRFGSLSFLVTGHGDIGEELDSSLDTEEAPPGQMRAGRSESEQLSMAQRRVFRLLVDGLSEKRIASQLKISSCTVHNHIGAIYRTFGVHSRAELLVCALSGKTTT